MMWSALLQLNTHSPWPHLLELNQGLILPSMQLPNSHMPVETAKCWWLPKIEPNVWAGGKGSCAVCVDLQAVGALQFFGEVSSLAKWFGPFLRGL